MRLYKKCVLVDNTRQSWLQHQNAKQRLGGGYGPEIWPRIVDHFAQRQFLLRRFAEVRLVLPKTGKVWHGICQRWFLHDESLFLFLSLNRSLAHSLTHSLSFSLSLFLSLSLSLSFSLSLCSAVFVSSVSLSRSLVRAKSAQRGYWIINLSSFFFWRFCQKKA